MVNSYYKEYKHGTYENPIIKAENSVLNNKPVPIIVPDIPVKVKPKIIKVKQNKTTNSKPFV